jgi:hypothetical protein
MSGPPFGGPSLLWRSWCVPSARETHQVEGGGFGPLPHFLWGELIRMTKPRFHVAAFSVCGIL